MSDGSRHIEFIYNAAGTRLGLHRYPAIADRTGVALLAHGTFSNHRSCRRLAGYLAARGVECWLLDFQGHGVSDRPAREPDFESMCLLDARAALDFLQLACPGQRISWVGHSGGGLAIMMLLVRYPEYREQVASFVAVASQATDAGINRRHRLAIRAASLATAVLGVAPGRAFRLGPENEFAAVMQQWYGWSLSKRWTGKDGLDYEPLLSGLRQRCLMLAASADPFIAPVSGCERLFRALGGQEKTFRVCGTDTGFIEDYTHARIISSRNASLEVWPLIARAL